MKKQEKNWMQIRRRVSEIIEVGASDDIPSRTYDMIGTAMLLTNVVVTILYTFDSMELRYGDILLLLEAITVAFFAVDYCLRVWAAPFLYPSMPERRALRKYVLSFSDLVDLLSFLPYYLPFFSDRCGGIPLFRVVRIFRIYYYGSHDGVQPVYVFSGA